MISQVNISWISSSLNWLNWVDQNTVVIHCIISWQDTLKRFFLFHLFKRSNERHHNICHRYFRLFRFGLLSGVRPMYTCKPSGGRQPFAWIRTTDSSWRHRRRWGRCGFCELILISVTSFIARYQLCRTMSTTVRSTGFAVNTEGSWYHTLWISDLRCKINPPYLISDGGR